jgi:hypothetical protein
MCAFLWTGTEVVSAGTRVVAWSRVQRPMAPRGLGVMDLRLQGMALRMCWFLLLLE